MVSVNGIASTTAAESTQADSVTALPGSSGIAEEQSTLTSARPESVAQGGLWSSVRSAFQAIQSFFARMLGSLLSIFGRSSKNSVESDQEKTTAPKKSEVESAQQQGNEEAPAASLLPENDPAAPQQGPAPAAKVDEASESAGNVKGEVESTQQQQGNEAAPAAQLLAENDPASPQQGLAPASEVAEVPNPSSPEPVSAGNVSALPQRGLASASDSSKRDSASVWASLENDPGSAGVLAAFAALSTSAPQEQEAVDLDAAAGAAVEALTAVLNNPQNPPENAEERVACPLTATPVAEEGEEVEEAELRSQASDSDCGTPTH